MAELLTREIVKYARHRNGICGYPFHVGIITDDDGTTKVFVHFEETEEEAKEEAKTGIWQNPRTAILDIELLAKGVIEFGENSHRGDHYSTQIKDYITADLLANDLLEDESYGGMKE